MNNSIRMILINFLLGASFECMEIKKHEVLQRQQKSTDSGLLQTIYEEVGITKKFCGYDDLIIINDYDASFPRKLSEEERTKAEQITKNWSVFMHDGYVFGSSSEPESAEGSLTISTGSDSSSARRKDSLEAIYRLVEKKELDLQETQLPRN